MEDKDFREFVSRILGKDIGDVIGEGADGMVYEFDKFRVIKIQTETENLDAVINLSKSPVPGIVRIFSVGKIKLPKKFWEHFGKKLAFVIMEKLFPNRQLSDNLRKISKLWIEFSKENQLNKNKPISAFYALRDIALSKDKEIIKKFLFFIEEKSPELLETLMKLLKIFENLKDVGINWGDIHPEQFAYNKNGEIRAFDIDYAGNAHLGLEAVPQNLLKTKQTYGENIFRNFIKELLIRR